MEEEIPPGCWMEHPVSGEFTRTRAVFRLDQKAEADSRIVSEGGEGWPVSSQGEVGSAEC